MIRVIDIFFLSVLAFFYPMMAKRMTEIAVGNNKFIVQKFRCCDHVDWIVSDRLTQGNDIAVIPGKLQPSSVQLISRECHCYIPKEQLLLSNGQKVRFYCYRLYCSSY
jgi:hypothetical protein